MKVALVSTYPPQRCGIGTYTHALAEALGGIEDLEVSVLSERGALDGRDGPVVSLPVFARNRPWIEPLVAAAVANQARVVHVQHAHDIFGMDDRLPRLCRRLGQRNIKTVVTLHSVYTRASGLLQRKLGVVRFHRTLARYCDALVVHQRDGMLDVLEAQGVPAEKIHIVAHGTEHRTIPNGTLARRELGLPPREPVLLCFGFIHALKNLHTPIRAMARVREQFPGARLIIAGSVQRGRWYNRIYLKGLRELIARLRLQDNVQLMIGFIPEARIDELYAAADLLLLPHQQRYGSSSGVAHLALAAGTPVLFSDSPKFAELAETFGAGFRVHGGADAWAKHLLGLLGDREQLQRAAERAQQIGRETGWSTIARQTASLYRGLVG